MNKKILLIPIFLLLTGCDAGIENTDVKYLNYKYVLKSVVDLHGEPITSNEVLERNVAPENRERDIYTDYFERTESFINFQCMGSAHEEIKCETTFSLKLKTGDFIFNLTDKPFYTKYVGEQYGNVFFEDEDVKNIIGEIVVYTPYWCRWQYSIDIDNDGEAEFLTFEFWKKDYNPLPDLEDK